jgi:hypothetical protein
MAQVNGTQGVNLWSYNSADAAAAVRGAGYITNAGDLGMKVGDVVIVVDSNLEISNVDYVSAISAGAATLVVTI